MPQNYIADVLVVNYNGGAYLQRCVESVLQSNAPVHLIVIDNCSADESMDKLQECDVGIHKLSCVVNTNNVGFSKAVNQAANIGHSEFVFLLNPDCELYPHTVSNLVAEMQGQPKAGVMGALVFNEDGSEQRGCRRLEPTFSRSVVTAFRLDKYFTSVNLQHSALPNDVEVIDAVSGSAMMVRRTTFDEIEGMDEGYFLHVEDLDFCRRVREAGQQVMFTPNVSLFHCQGVSTNKVPYTMEWYKHEGMLRYHAKYQKPNQNILRSAFSRSIIYLNYILSIARHGLRRKSSNDLPEQPIRLSHSFAGKVVLTGASSDLGAAILKSVANEALPVIAVTRQKIPKTRVANEIWLNWGFFEKVPTQDLGVIDQWLAVSPIWSASVVANVLSRYHPPTRVVAFSSTSIEGKRQSRDKTEQNVVTALEKGELDLLAWAQKNKVDLTIARASMIYGGANNKNVNLIKRLIKLFRFFPLLGAGNAIRQPVHVEDLARATHQLRVARDLPMKTYNLAGGEALSYKEMVERIFLSINQKARFIHVSSGVLMTMVAFLNKVPGLSFVKGALVTRMQNDLRYDVSPAKTDFEYSPKTFRP
ncbi:MAG: GT2 family glycosyltransferase/dTDP-4-dehydrorhamnose reductase [Gammaproteobacteria bacterium]|jgi:GT2 family glycosyltransferase/dTDP-4-dehydrorhamnose reductase